MVGSSTGSLSLGDSIVEEHNFFNGLPSPANNKYAINSEDVIESFKERD